MTGWYIFFGIIFIGWALIGLDAWIARKVRRMSRLYKGELPERKRKRKVIHLDDWEIQAWHKELEDQKN